jgi:tRNA-modifying protein YgfZ
MSSLAGMTNLAHLPARGAIEVAGEDRVGFLQGLVSNDVAEAEALRRRLSRYRLRSKVALRDASAELVVYAAWPGAPDLPEDAVAAPDPRLPKAGWRILAPGPLPANAGEAEWDLHRLALGLPDGSRDLEAQKSVLLEAGFDELNGVSWSKGCYLGQELTARTKYRGLVKRRLVPVAVEGELPAPGTPVHASGREVGTMRSGRGQRGLALLRIEALGERLSCGAATLLPQVPAWMALPQPAA